jgi:hypothetical protein
LLSSYCIYTEKFCASDTVLHLPIDLNDHVDGSWALSISKSGAAVIST